MSTKTYDHACYTVVTGQSIPTATTTYVYS